MPNTSPGCTRSRRRLFRVFVAVPLLTSCGGSDGAPSLAPPQSQASACLAQVSIDLLGDSTMAGYDGTSLVVHTPAVELQADLDARFGRHATVVLTHAVAGSTSAEFIAGSDGRNARWPASVQTDVIVVNFGINDMTHDGGAGLPAYKERMRLLARTASPAVLVFETPNKVKTRDVEPWAQAMREVASEFALPLADTYAYSTVGLLNDWAHPTDAGYVAIVDNALAPVVAKVVESLLCRPGPEQAGSAASFTGPRKT